MNTVTNGMMMETAKAAADLATQSDRYLMIFLAVTIGFFAVAVIRWLERKTQNQHVEVVQLHRENLALIKEVTGVVKENTVVLGDVRNTLEETRSAVRGCLSVQELKTKGIIGA